MNTSKFIESRWHNAFARMVLGHWRFYEKSLHLRREKFRRESESPWPDWYTLKSVSYSVNTARVPQGVLEAKGLVIIQEIAIDDVDRTWHIANRNLGTLPTERNARFEVAMLPFGFAALGFT